MATVTLPGVGIERFAGGTLKLVMTDRDVLAAGCS